MHGGSRRWGKLKYKICSRKGKQTRLADNEVVRHKAGNVINLLAVWSASMPKFGRYSTDLFLLEVGTRILRFVWILVLKAERQHRDKEQFTVHDPGNIKCGAIKAIEYNVFEIRRYGVQSFKKVKKWIWFDHEEEQHWITNS